MKKLKSAQEQEVIGKADVICVTCVGAGDPRISGIAFERILVDESAQACEPECLIPMTRGATQILLVGDHFQLEPNVRCQKACESGFQRSMFERMVINGAPCNRLQVQYRMHPQLLRAPSNLFYEGTLSNGVKDSDRTMTTVSSLWLKEGVPMLFYDTGEVEEKMDKNLDQVEK